MSTVGASTSSPPVGVQARAARVLGSVIVWLRAGAIGFGWVLILLGQEPVDPAWLVVATGLLLVFFVWRVLSRTSPIRELRAGTAVEPLVAIVAVLVSGGWGSPFVLYLGIPVLNVAMAMGTPVTAVVGAFLAILATQEALDTAPASPPEIAQTLVPIAVAAAVGLAGRGLLSASEDDDSGTLGRIEQLTHVNALLSTLHDLVRSTPAPLTVEDVLRVIRLEVGELVDVDTILLLLADEGGRWWRPVSIEGLAIGRQIARADLPAEVLADQSTRPVEIPRLAEGTGVTPRARSGAYLWLFSRGRPAALLVLEHGEPRELPPARLEVLERLSAPLGLAVDNAVWFQRLRTLGAEEERQRIGAAIHDQFAQSLAYVNMELERLVAVHPDDAGLAQLQEVVHDTLADLRETLRELRLRCTEEHGLAPTLAGHLQRFGDRHGIQVEFDATGEVRAPLSVENQLLRAAQDLLVLAQREAGATAISVVVAAEPGRFRLVVRDDGRGITEEDMGHEASRILSLVRDRVDAVGGLVDVLARPGEGTEVAVTVRAIR